MDGRSGDGAETNHGRTGGAGSRFSSCNPSGRAIVFRARKRTAGTFRYPATPSVLLLLSLLAHGCSVAGGPPPPPAPPVDVSAGWTQEGIASWYGEPFHGRQTASGEIYDMEASTAAHRTLPFGTRLRVRNVDNGRTATLTVNDRGPFVGGRILDVSRRMARELGIIGPGTARVRITVLNELAPPGCWMVQVGAFAGETNARALRDRLEREGHRVRIVPSPDGLHRVRMGPYADVERAGQIAARYGGFILGC